MKQHKHSKKHKKHHLTIETPCCISNVECFLRTISNIGHWHDAVIHAKNNALIVEYEDDVVDQLSS